MAYTKPTPAELKARYTTFAAVADATIQIWLTDAERYADETWMEADYAPALMAMAAHNMTLEGLGTEAEATADLPPGITAMRIGTLGLNFDSGITREKAMGSFKSTRYGAYYLTLLYRNKRGPRVTTAGTQPFPGVSYPMGEW